MEQRDIEVLSGFEAVWARVYSGGDTAQQPDPLQPLEAVMDGLHAAWSGYRQLACCSCGDVRRRLSALAEETKCVFRELQLEYFLAAGELYHPKESGIFASCTMSNLRKLWKNASDLTQMLQAVPQGDGNICAEKIRDAEAVVACQKTTLRQIMAGMM